MAADMLGVELARPGTWHLSSGKKTFAEQDLQDAADFFVASGHQRIPIGFGHNDSRFDGDPAFGWVSNIRYQEDADGPVLLGDLVDLEDWVAAAAPARWPNRSIQGFSNLDFRGRRYRLALTRLALLGATPPGMPNLKSLADLKAAVAAPMAITVAARAHYGRHTGTYFAATQETTMDPEVFREALGLEDMTDAEVMEALADAGFIPASAPEQSVAAASVPWSGVVDEGLYRQTLDELFPPGPGGRDAPRARVAATYDPRYDPDADITAAWPEWQRASLMATSDPEPVNAAAYGQTNPTPLDHLRRDSPSVYMAAIRNGAPPGMFGGSYDPGEYLRSGLPSGALNDLPWQGQVAAWHASTPQGVHDVRRDLAGELGEVYAQVTPKYSDHPGVRDWVAAIHEWATRAPLPVDEIDPDWDHLWPPGHGPMAGGY